MIGRGFLLGLALRADATPNGCGGARNAPQIGGKELRGGGCAGGSAGEKQLGMDEPDFAGQIGALDKGRRELVGCQRRWNSNVRDLADAAGPVALAFGMDMAGGDDDKEDGESAQRESQKSSSVLPANRIPLPFYQRKPTPARLDARG